MKAPNLYILTDENNRECVLNPYRLTTKFKNRGIVLGQNKDEGFLLVDEEAARRIQSNCAVSLYKWTVDYYENADTYTVSADFLDGAYFNACTRVDNIVCSERTECQYQN